MKLVTETAAGQSIAAYVILKKNAMVGKVHVYYNTKSGGVTVNAWDYTREESFMKSHASGYGYDKFTAAVSGMLFDGHTISNHCGVKAPTPKCGYFTNETKLPKGYSVCNGISIHKPSGKRATSINVYEGERFSHRLWYVPKFPQGTGYWGPTESEIKANPDNYQLVDSEDIINAYHDAYKTPGLDYLRALGYSVIQAI
jgi:hypothetical protein